MTSRVVVFPFDLFGSAGTGAGAQLLGDAILEMLADADEETVPLRAGCYRDSVVLNEFEFDTPNKCSRWRTTANQAVGEYFSQDDSLIWLAGNHLGVLPIYEALGPETLVLQFDAHLDVYNLSDCTDELSHGNFLLHAEQSLPTIINIGSRDLFLDPAHAQDYFHTIHSAVHVATDPQAVVKAISAAVKKAKRVWLDIDCDAFDPAFFPAVQNTQPFGLTPAFVLGLLQTIWSPKIAGLSISEFDPGRDQRDQSLGTLIWLVEWFLLRSHGDSGC